MIIIDVSLRNSIKLVWVMLAKLENSHGNSNKIFCHILGIAAFAW